MSQTPGQQHVEWRCRRANVGICLFNDQGLVFAGRRVPILACSPQQTATAMRTCPCRTTPRTRGCWQLPQVGLCEHLVSVEGPRAQHDALDV